jgi:hypothetical protein
MLGILRPRTLQLYVLREFVIAFGLALESWLCAFSPAYGDMITDDGQVTYGSSS